MANAPVCYGCHVKYYVFTLGFFLLKNTLQSSYIKPAYIIIDLIHFPLHQLFENYCIYYLGLVLSLHFKC